LTQTRRVLVTGSRDWQSRMTIYKALWGQLNRLSPWEEMVVVHGDCPYGADRIAREWVEARRGRLPVREERHPADWARWGKSAGYRRNAEMVNAGADICLAFIRNNSRGASMTAKLAREAGIPVVVWRED